jgi:undecaprenyl-diphosphatase
MLKLQQTLGWVQSVDSRLCVKVSHTGQYRFIRHSFRAISRMGDGMFWYLLMLVIALTQGQAGLYVCLQMLTVGLTGTLVYKWLKHRTSRPRPFQVRQDVLLSGTPLDYFSFPSGHTLHAVAFGMVAVQHYPQLFPIIYPFVVLVGMSRVVLGLHYPSDVLAGAGIGYVLVALYSPLF